MHRTRPESLLSHFALNVGVRIDCAIALIVRKHEAAEKDAGAVIVSLEGATYFDSAMIHRLLMFRRQLSVNRQTFVLVKPTLQAAQRLLGITG